MKHIPLLLVLGVLLMVMSGCSTVESNTIKNDISCQSDEDCKTVDCSEYQNQLPRFYGICESNTCICGCGNPENGTYCR
ncbi:hypothetical protein HYW21_08375 [Candidatus Woesearchaeota archaeon]|nr:hypothetical protein [Candidatus Woesearchaeota archaeon]